MLMPEGKRETQKDCQSNISDPSTNGENGILANTEINGRYQVIENIGEGSFGRVYKVWDPSSSSYLALKQIYSLKGQKRFPQEIEVTVYLIFRRERQAPTTTPEPGPIHELIR